MMRMPKGDTITIEMKNVGIVHHGITRLKKVVGLLRKARHTYWQSAEFLGVHHFALSLPLMKTRR